ncbi:MAG: sensor histidine kinase [Jatrophihabitans sp.]|nr:MAG: sensor histidine kinase [Jatrophihabitans sp.]
MAVATTLTQDGAAAAWPEGVELPRYSLWRRVPAWEPQGRWLRDRPQMVWPDTVFSIVLAPWVLRALLAVGLVLGQVTMGGGVAAHLAAAGLTGALWGWIEWWLTWDLAPLWRRLLALAGQGGLSAAVIALSPLGGIVVWSHSMICGTFFTGPLLLGTIAGSSVLMTAVQVGGFALLSRNGTLTAGLFALDVTIGLVSIGMANRREEAVLRRNAITGRLLAEQQRNADLQQQLLDQARTAGVREERARLARDLHDTVAQGLVAVVTQLEAIEDAHLADDRTRRRVDDAKALARQSLTEARRAVNALRPPALDDADLPEAMAVLVREWGAVNHVCAELTVSGSPRPTAADATLLRVAQEALSNAARHAGARRVAVSLDYLDDEVLLDVHDDGRGFDTAAGRRPSAAGGHGLSSMTERLRLAGGSLAVESEPGAGCVVSAAVPG